MTLETAYNYPPLEAGGEIGTLEITHSLAEWDSETILFIGRNPAGQQFIVVAEDDAPERHLIAQIPAEVAEGVLGGRVAIRDAFTGSKALWYRTAGADPVPVEVNQIPEEDLSAPDMYCIPAGCYWRIMEKRKTPVVPGTVTDYPPLEAGGEIGTLEITHSLEEWDSATILFIGRNPAGQQFIATLEEFGCPELHLIARITPAVADGVLQGKISIRDAFLKAEALWYHVAGSGPMPLEADRIPERDLPPPGQYHKVVGQQEG